FSDCSPSSSDRLGPSIGKSEFSNCSGTILDMNRSFWTKLVWFGAHWTGLQCIWTDWSELKDAGRDLGSFGRVGPLGRPLEWIGPHTTQFGTRWSELRSWASTRAVLGLFVGCICEVARAQVRSYTRALTGNILLDARAEMRAAQPACFSSSLLGYNAKWASRDWVARLLDSPSARLYATFHAGPHKRMPRWLPVGPGREMKNFRACTRTMGAYMMWRLDRNLGKISASVPRISRDSRVESRHARWSRLARMSRLASSTEAKDKVREYESGLASQGRDSRDGVATRETGHDFPQKMKIFEDARLAAWEKWKLRLATYSARILKTRFLLQNFNLGIIIRLSNFVFTFFLSRNSFLFITLHFGFRLSLGDFRPTLMYLQLAERSIRYLKGIVEDVLMKVGKLIIPVDFVVLDVGDVHENGKDHTILLRRPFMATNNTLTDVKNGTLNMTVLGKSMSISVQEAMSSSSANFLEECAFIDLADPFVDEMVFQEFEE
ncbi:Unknown protein, partial [Striga hermonthica]